MAHVVKQRGGRRQPFVDLTISNPTAVLSDYPDAEIASAFADIDSFQYDPNPLGFEPARIAIARYFAERGIPADPQSLLLTASTSEAYALLFKLLCDPGDQILAPAPSYPLFEFLAHLECVQVSHYRLRFDGSWYIDFDHLRHAITERTRAIIIVNPNNPTGSFLKRHEATTLLRIAGEHGIPIISDEVFLDYGFEPSADRLSTLTGKDDVLSFSLNGLSKCAGMPQMKLGWIAVNGPDAERESAFEKLELISDTYLSVGTPVQRALSGLLEIGRGIQRRLADRTRTNIAILQRKLEGAPAHALHCEGGWSAIIRLPSTQSEENWTLRLLDDCGVLVQPGYFFDMETEPHIVVSLIGSEDEFEEGLERIAGFVAAD